LRKSGGTCAGFMIMPDHVHAWVARITRYPGRSAKRSADNLHKS
jgi:hypothetical protein